MQHVNLSLCSYPFIANKVEQIVKHNCYGLFKLNKHLVLFSKCEEEDVIDFILLHTNLHFNEFSGLYTIAIFFPADKSTIRWLCLSRMWSYLRQQLI